MRDTVVRFTVSLAPALLEQFDEVCAAKGYSSRSEAIRDAIREYLTAQANLPDSEAEVVCSLTLLVDASAPPVTVRGETPGVRWMGATQAATGGGTRLEVLLFQGRPHDVAELANSLQIGSHVHFARLVSAGAP